MTKQVVTSTYTAPIRNQSQVQDELDSLGFAASKLWNIGRWTCSQTWIKSITSRTTTHVSSVNKLLNHHTLSGPQSAGNALLWAHKLSYWRSKL
jgi:putative transposase